MFEFKVGDTVYLKHNIHIDWASYLQGHRFTVESTDYTGINVEDSEGAILRGVSPTLFYKVSG